MCGSFEIYLLLPSTLYTPHICQLPVLSAHLYSISTILIERFIKKYRCLRRSAVHLVVSEGDLSSEMSMRSIVEIAIYARYQ